MIRPATYADLERALEMADSKRQQYAAYQPIFHRSAEGARETQAPYFRDLVDRDDVMTLVHEDGNDVDAFITCQQLHGMTLSFMVDDFVVAEPGLWATAGRELFEAARIGATERGGVHMQVHCGPRDLPKRTMLEEAGLTVMRELAVNHDPLVTVAKALPRGRHDDTVVRRARVSEVDELIKAILEQHERYRQFDSIFYGYAGDSEHERAKLLNCVRSEDSIALTTQMNGRAFGIIVADSIPPPPVYEPGGPVYFVNYFAVLTGQWATAGVQLMATAIRMLAERNAALLIVSSMPGDPEKSEAIAQAGLTVVTQFYRAYLSERK